MPIVTDYIRRIFGGPNRFEKYMGDNTHATRVLAAPPSEMVSGDRLKVELDEPIAVTLPHDPLPVLITGQPISVNLPDKLITDGGIAGSNPRFRVDVGQTGFFDRRMWALNYEFASANPIAATPLVFRLIIPTNFIIHAHALSVDQGGMTLRTYAAAQGTPGGTFSTTYAPVSENSMTESAAYTFQSTIASGGTFTPTAGQLPLTPLRVRTANATAQQSSVGGESVSEKGRPAGTYYAVLSRMTGVSGDCTGVYSLVIEERP
jgi:hypothetical protein